MKSVFAPFILAAAALLGGWVYQRFLAIDGNADPELRIRLREISKLFRALKAAKTEGSYAGVVLPPTANRDPMESAYVQFSIENGRVGLDWVLESQQNIDDQNRFAEVARSLGHRFEEREMNEVRYLRVEDGDLAGLATSLLKQLYGISDRDDLRLQVEGFQWAVKEAAV